MVYNEKQKEAIYRWRVKKHDHYCEYQKGIERYVREAAKFRNILFENIENKPIAKRLVYNETIKTNIYKWRHNNKEKFNEYMRGWQRKKKEAINVTLDNTPPSINEFFSKSLVR